MTAIVLAWAACVSLLLPCDGACVSLQQRGPAAGIEQATPRGEEHACHAPAGGESSNHEDQRGQCSHCADLTTPLASAVAPLAAVSATFALPSLSQGLLAQATPCLWPGARRMPPWTPTPLLSSQRLQL
jgi:hypothetical protein